MGEYADDAIDRAMDEEEDLSLWRMGLLSPLEAYDRGIIDDLGNEYPHRPAWVTTLRPIPRPIVCRHCGRADLHWLKTEKGWRTAEPTGNIHDCPTFHKETS